MSDFNNNLLSLITMFLQQKTEAPAFSLEFLQRYKQGNEPVQEPYGRFFDAIFAACDAYCEDENLRDEFDFDAQQLYDRVQELYQTI